MSKNVIIFSASTGHGHNQVANTLKDELIEQGFMVNVVEPFKEANQHLDEFVSDGYRILATKAPKMFGRIYKMSNRSLVNKSIAMYTRHVLDDSLEALINENDGGLVICTHPLFVKAVCYLKRKERFDGKVISVITDYMPHAFYVSKEVDAYIVGSNSTKLSLVQKGIIKERIHVYGIPIKREFESSISQKEHSERFTVLLMGGSMGVKGIKKAYKRLLAIEEPLKLYVVCGNNDVMKGKLEGYDTGNHDVELFGFTNKVPELMDLSDVIISKPGGLTVTESLAKNIPMIIPYCIPGQEEENAELLVKSGAAIRVEGSKELRKTVRYLQENRSELEKMKDNMEMIARDHSLDKVLKLCTALYEDYEAQRVYPNG